MLSAHCKTGRPLPTCRHEHAAPIASPPRSQLLINNAGIYSADGRRPKLEEFKTDDFLPTFVTNSVGPFLVVQQLLARQLLGPPGSLVVNVSSIMASNQDPTVSAVTPGAYAYRCAGGRLRGASRGPPAVQARDALLPACARFEGDHRAPICAQSYARAQNPAALQGVKGRAQHHDVDACARL